MIPDHLDKCLFCGSKMYSTSEDIAFICPNEAYHRPDIMWGYYSTTGVRLNVVNIRLKDYQLCWQLDLHKTILWSIKYDTISHILTAVNGLVSFDNFTEEAVRNKIKTMLTFM